MTRRVILTVLRPKDNFWFVAFAPCNKPEIVVSVLWEGGEWGKNSAPVAPDVSKSYLDKKARNAEVELQKQNVGTPALSILIQSPGTTTQNKR